MSLGYQPIQSSPTHLSIHLPIHLCIYLTHPGIHPSTHPPIYLTHSPIHPSIHLPIHRLSTYPSIDFILQLSIHVHVNLPTHALFTQLPSHPPTTIHPHIHLFTKPHSHTYIHSAIYPSIYLFISLFIYPPQPAISLIPSSKHLLWARSCAKHLRIHRLFMQSSSL